MDKMNFQLGLSEELLGKIRASADRNQQSVSDEICGRLEDSFLRPSLPKPLQKKISEYQKMMPLESDRSFEGTLGFLVQSGFRYLRDYDKDYNARLENEKMSLRLRLEAYEKDADGSGAETQSTSEDLIERLKRIDMELEDITDVMLEEGRRLQSSHKLLVEMKRQIRHRLEAAANKDKQSEAETLRTDNTKRHSRLD